MRIPRGGRWLNVSRQLADDRRAQSATCTKARIGVPQIVQAHASQTSPFGEAGAKALYACDCRECRDRAMAVWLACGGWT